MVETKGVEPSDGSLEESPEVLEAAGDPSMVGAPTEGPLTAKRTGTEPVDPDLALVQQAWSALPAALRAGIVAMVREDRTRSRR
jgi:hypothetical protein